MHWSLWAGLRTLVTTGAWQWRVAFTLEHHHPLIIVSSWGNQTDTFKVGIVDLWKKTQFMCAITIYIQKGSMCTLKFVCQFAGVLVDPFDQTMSNCDGRWKPKHSIMQFTTVKLANYKHMVSDWPGWAGQGKHLPPHLGLELGRTSKIQVPGPRPGRAPKVARV